MLDQPSIMMNPGDEIMRRLDEIAAFSEPGPGVTRRPFTENHHKAVALLTAWMERAGLSTQLDAAGTLIGRREPPPGGKMLLIGSHQDSIRCGGKYDGIYGIVLPIYVLETLKDQDLPFGVEILAFADEEGVRFPTALMGPRALAGTFNPDDLKGKDADGVVMGEALRAFGGNPDGLTDLKRDPASVHGYLEVHIEQGPVLESKNLAVGVVTAICGIERWTVELAGQASHAGTTPMDLRKDAYAGAAEIALEIERYCQEVAGLVGVVGSMSVWPNVPNAIPGKARFTMEFRSPEDHIREQAGADLAEFVRQTAARRRLLVDLTKTYAQDATPCDPTLSDALAEALSSEGHSAFRLMSGATHDASAMADLCPVAMLFTRCKDGLSHHPDESITSQDAQATAECLTAFLTTGT